MFGTGNKFAPLIFKPGISPPAGLTPPEWSSLGAAGSAIVIAAAALIQYAAVTGPVFVPSAAAPLNWQPKYPDQPTGRTFQTANQQTFASGFRPIIPSLTSWEPNLPDRNEVRAFPTAEQKAWTGPIAPVAAATPFGWLTTAYPSSLAADSDLEIGRIGLVLPIEPPFSRATYPDWFPQPQWKWLQGGEVHPISFTAPPAAPPLSWKPTYPDRLDYSTYPASEQLAFASGFVPIIPKTSWEPSFPDQLFRISRPWEQFYSGPIFPPAAVVPPLGWLGTAYPPRTEVSVDLEMGRLVLAVPPDVPLVIVGYPDWLARAPFQIIGGEARPLFFAAPAPAPLGSWQPDYPDLFKLQFPQAPFSVGVGTILPPTPPRGWLPTFPDRFPQPYVAPASGWYGPVLLIITPPPPTDASIIVIHRGRFKGLSRGVVHRGEGRLIT